MEHLFMLVLCVLLVLACWRAGYCYARIAFRVYHMLDRRRQAVAPEPSESVSTGLCVKGVARPFKVLAGD